MIGLWKTTGSSKFIPAFTGTNYTLHQLHTEEFQITSAFLKQQERIFFSIQTRVRYNFMWMAKRGGLS